MAAWGSIVTRGTRLKSVIVFTAGLSSATGTGKVWAGRRKQALAASAEMGSGVKYFIIKPVLALLETSMVANKRSPTK
ncbi:MAG: hypothetical protein A3G24_01405 [Betaproteobacteria bacterium RIFCSPLOWO2_12_FULL_62_13]|nr:MAG: hypothetical protein A3G24_01405 [Betaproteobacteria bacterium RIFCSPLOWO2_12_FULL_62_13]